MRVTSSTLLSLRSSQSAWTHMTVEWSPNVSLVQSQLLPVATHFVLPDLPSVYSDQSRAQYFQETAPNQRIRTIACSHHTTDKCLLETIRQLPSCDKILLVGGNDKKSSSTLSTTEAAKIILSSSEKIVELWGVTNPNDPNSVDSVGEKIQAGITGFLTQPLLSSTALETIHEYNLNETVPLIAGLALPTSAKNLQFGVNFWSNLNWQRIHYSKVISPFFLNPTIQV